MYGARGNCRSPAKPCQDRGRRQSPPFEILIGDPTSRYARAKLFRLNSADIQDRFSTRDATFRKVPILQSSIVYSLVLEKPHCTLEAGHASDGCDNKSMPLVLPCIVLDC